jgi:glycosyltransferase involved in cell wall biosynthesis
VLFMGDGEMRGELEALAKKEPCVRMAILGFQNQKNLSPYFHASDMLILPSLRSETWGLVVNEALHHGVPCMVSEAVGAAPDLIHTNRTGAVCHTGSAASLAAGVTSMLPLVKLSVTRQACRKAVVSYVVEEAARGIATAFHAALSSAASA